MDTGPPDLATRKLEQLVRFYAEDVLTAPEVVNAIFNNLGWDGRVDLADEVVRVLPDPVREELARVVEKALTSGAAYRPWVLGHVSEAWVGRMVPACRQLAVAFRDALARRPEGS